MAKKSASTARQLTSYELLAARLQRAINNPASQKAKAALLERLNGDSVADWDQVLAELSETDNVTLAHRDDGHVQIFWTVPDQD